jgi:hypothetical protein
MIARGSLVVAALMLVMEDIDWRPHTIIKKGETVITDSWDEWQLWVRPTKLHKGLARYDNAFSVDWWDETTLRKLKPVA